MKAHFKKPFRVWARHAGDMVLNAMTFVLSVVHIRKEPSDAMRKQLHWVEENSSVSGPTAFMPETITVLSWNVFKGYYEDEFTKSLHNLMQKHNPDIIVFQEAPMYPGGSFLQWPENFRPSSLVYISSQKKTPGVHDYEHTGELTVSALPHSDASFYLFPKITNQVLLQNDEYLHRNFLYTKWHTRSGSLGMYNVHFESMTTPLHRIAEVKALYEVIEKNDDDIAIVAGDLNTFMGTAFEPAVQFLNKKGFVNGFNPGLDQWVPRRDHIFVRGAKGIKSMVLPRRGSDHKPVVAKIQL